MCSCSKFISLSVSSRDQHTAEVRKKQTETHRMFCHQRIVHFTETEIDHFVGLLWSWRLKCRRIALAHATSVYETRLVTKHPYYKPRNREKRESKSGVYKAIATSNDEEVVLQRLDKIWNEKTKILNKESIMYYRKTTQIKLDQVVNKKQWNHLWITQLK